MELHLQSKTILTRLCVKRKIRLDDWSRAVAELPNAAKVALDGFGENAASVFLMEPAA